MIEFKMLDYYSYYCGIKLFGKEADFQEEETYRTTTSKRHGRIGKLNKEATDWKGGDDEKSI